MYTLQSAHAKLNFRCAVECVPPRKEYGTVHAPRARKSNPAGAFCKGTVTVGTNVAASTRVNTDLVQAKHALERGDTTDLATRMRAAFPHDPRAAKARERCLDRSI
jgi:hypothetical protein